MNDENDLHAIALRLSATAEMSRIATEFQDKTNLARMYSEHDTVKRAIANLYKPLQGLSVAQEVLRNFHAHEQALACFNLHERSGVLKAMAEHTKYTEMARKLIGGGAYELAKQHQLLYPHVSAIMASLTDQTKLNAKFALTDITRQLAEYQLPVGMSVKRATELAEQLSVITTPWSVKGSEYASVAAALSLTQFSEITRTLPAFSDERSAIIVAEFGEFDTAFPLAEVAKSDEESEAIYSEAGRNEALVAFPSSSYDQILSAAGWSFDIKQPDFIRQDGTIVPGAVFDPYDHHIINLVEGHLRQAIYTAIITVGGDQALTRLFSQYLPKWKEKQVVAVLRGEPPLHLIYYADFIELMEVILNKELWASHFKAIFVSRDWFRVSMERLHTIRIPTSHSRPVTKTRRLRLLVEAGEIFEALGLISRPHRI